MEMNVIESVKSILDFVSRSGDEALLYYAKLFDKADLTSQSLKVSAQEMDDACANMPNVLKEAIGVARNNIEAFHRGQLRGELRVETQPGVVCMRRSVPIQTVGLYIPGGSAPLFSTVLMLGIPAQLAGCPRVVLCTPPRPDGTVPCEILYCARLCGISEIYKVGGAVAIGALAYGTQTVPKVDKVFGPGNAYVTAAKQWVGAFVCATDVPAGPSEVLIAADETANAAFVCADFLSQLEHGPDSRAALVTTSKALADEVRGLLTSKAETYPRSSYIKKSLQKSTIEVFASREELLERINAMAPEHLILCCSRPYDFADGVQNAGSVFIGNYSPESAGDYASGTNHTLPTGGWARSFSGVSVDSFTKQITFQELTKEGLQRLAPVIEAMAMAEGLQAHADAVRVRLQEVSEK